MTKPARHAPHPITPALAPELEPALGPVHLVLLGIGAVIGAGIFVITGHAAAQYAGPGIVFSFIIAGLGCLFAGLCYAEFAAMVPLSGSAYTYTYFTMGKFLAWLIGWDLVLEYLAASSTVAVGWAGYFNDFISSTLGIHIPAALTHAPLDLGPHGGLVFTGAIINAPAVALVAAVSALLVSGIRFSAGFNNLMVAVKVAIVLLIIGFGLSHIHMANLTPFIPENQGHFGAFGWSGVLRATGVVFFSYIGFDAVSVTAQEAKNPQRDMPIGILGSLAICTVLYVLMCLVITGIAPYQTLNVAHPVSMAIEQADPSLHWLAPIVNVAAIAGLTSVVLVLLLGQSRIFYAMARDGFLPPMFAAIHPRFRTPWLSTIVTGLGAALLAGVLPIDILGELVSIGTLAAFVLVCVGIIILRKTRPELKRPFRTPWVPLVPVLGIVVCGGMMVWLPLDTWIRLLVWAAIGLVVYFSYGRKRAHKPTWAENSAEV